MNRSDNATQALRRLLGRENMGQAEFSSPTAEDEKALKKLLKEKERS